jgi:restriction system protein
MALPSYDVFMLPALRVLGDDQDHDIRELRERLAGEFKLAETDRRELLPSGKQPVFDSRIGWAKTYLEKAGLLATVRRGCYRITEVGKNVLAKNPEHIDKAYLLQFDSFRAFATRATDDENTTAEAAGEKSAPGVTPEEALERAHKEIRAKVETELLEAVGKASPRFFEKLVVELLVQMGYVARLKMRAAHSGGVMTVASTASSRRIISASMPSTSKRSDGRTTSAVRTYRPSREAWRASALGRASSSPRRASPTRRATT